MNHLSASPRSGIPASKRFSFAPIAAAVAAVLAAAASPCAFASHTAFEYDPGDNTKGVITLKLENISIGEDSEWLNASGALFTVDGFPINNPEVWDIPVRTAIEWWSYDSQTNNPLYSAVNSQGIPTDEHVSLTVTSNTDDFNLGWDFSNDTGEYYSYNPAIANFRPEVLDADSNDRYLKRFTFQSKTRSQIAVVTKNSLVGSTNSGDGEAMLGLSVLNKRGWMTFADETFLVSDFQFLYPDQIETASVDPSIPSGTEGQYIAAGVVTGFGASTNRPVNGQRLFDQLFTKDENGLTAEVLYKESLDKYGRIDFEKRSVVSVTAIASKDENFENHRGRLHEVFGVFANEGGAVEFMKGGDVLVKGRDKHHLVSALTSASTLGILDPLKSGEITFTAGTDVNRIWGWSDSYDGDTPITVENGEALFNNQGKLNDNAFVDMKGQIEDYLKKATGTGTTTEQHLRGSILAANGSNITVQDTADGWLDIRGDVVAAVKNGDGAGSNTFVAQDEDLSDGVHANSMAGTVTRATVNLTLSHEKSTLVGNVYERHRVGDGEAVQKETSGGASAIEQYQSFKDWQDEQYEKESLSLGGTVNLSISTGAVWYPTKDWKGWNYDFLYQEFFNETGDNEYGTVNEGYKYYDTSDQYNLHVKAENGSYEPANQPVPADGESVDSGKINDLDLLDGLKEGEVPGSIEVANEKPRDDQGQQTYKTVHGGVYHLTLNGGTVDLSYLRRNFKMSTAQEDLGVIAPNETIDVKGPEAVDVKKFRVQALDGESGNFRIYAKDATHHDLVIVDEMRNAQNDKLEGKAFDLNLVLWNDGIGDEHKLTINPDDKSTYIQVARVPDSVNVTAESYGEGRTTYTAYRVVKDEKTKDPVTGNMVYGEGSYTYEQGLEWHDQNVNWFIKGEAENRKDMAVIGTTELAANLGYLMATTMETLRDRRGEMAFNGTKEDGWWVRYTHDRFGLDGFTAETDGFQFGYEWMKPEEGGRLFRGAALDVAQGDVEYDSLSGDSEADRYRLSAYQTYMGDNGVYYDAVLRAGWYDAETNVAYTRHNGTVYDMKGNFDYWAAAASFEAGHRFESSSAWWIEPEVQLQYTYITDYDYKTNHGIRVDTDDTQSLIGRFGVRMGKVLTSDAGRHMSVWAGADVFHEWLGDRDGTMTGIDETVRYDISGDDTWWDTVFGMTWETGPDSRLWAAAKHDFGGDKENTWTVNVGATWNF